MPASLQSLTQKKVPLEVIFPRDDGQPDDRVKIVYRPHVINRKIEKEIQRDLAAMEEDEQSGMRVFAQFTKIIASWDLMADPTDDEPIPLTPEGLENVPYTVLGVIFRAITEDQNPDPTTRKGSGRRS